MSSRKQRHARWAIAFATLLIVASVAPARAQQPAPAPAPDGPTVNIYGFGQADVIWDFQQNNPDWYDVNRPSRLPAFEDQFGRDGNFWLSARQSRFGAKATIPTDSGNITAQFEFDMFGVGRDAGLTTIRLRHAWGQWKQIGAGLTNSQFMDGDVFPNILEYWGPNGMLFFRNVQVFWEPYSNGTSNARIAIEAPGGSGDAGLLSERVELQNISGRFPAPDLTGHFRLGRSWGYLQFGGALRYFSYDDLLRNDAFDLDGNEWGGGVSISSNVKFNANVLRLQWVYGQGIQNYFNDAPVDVGPERVPNNPVTPVKGEALPITGYVIYLDHNWSTAWSTAIGYSQVDVDNSDLQRPDAFRIGRYASVNLLRSLKNVMMGGEFQWARRENFSDGFEVDDMRLQFSFKYSFSATVKGD
jgi:hypothetical protein